MGLLSLAERELTLEIKNPGAVALLLLLAAICIMELQVTFATPISFGDEGFHTSMAQWIAENVEYPAWIPITQTLVSKAPFERPPVWNLLEASLFYLVGFNEAIVKSLTPIISMLTGIATYMFAKKFYNERVGFIAALVLVTLPSLVTYSVFFYTDALTTFFTIMFMTMFSLSVKTGRRLHMMGAGAFGALTFMSKISGYVIYAFVALFFIYYFFKERKFFTLIKRYSPFFLILILVVAAFFIRNYSHYGTPVCGGLPIVGMFLDRFFDSSGCYFPDIESEYEYAGRTEQVGTESDVFRMGLVSYLEFAYGNVWVVILAFLSGLSLMYLRGSDGGKTGVADKVLILMLLLLIPVFLVSTKRAEDTSRYSLMWAPAISIIAAKFFEGAYGFIKRHQRHVAFLVFVFIIIYCLFGFGYLDPDRDGTIGTYGVRGHGIIEKLFGYNLMQNGELVHVSGLVDVKRFSSLFFEACDWAKENTPKDSMFSTLWSYRTSYSCQRSVAANPPDIMLSNNVSQVLSTAEKLGVTHIFVQKFSIDYQNRHLQEKYDWDFVQFLENNPENFKKIFENGPDLTTCRQQGGCDGNVIYEIDNTKIN